MVVLRGVDAHEERKEDEEPVDYNDEHVFPERLRFRVASLERGKVHEDVGDCRVMKEVANLKNARKSAPHDGREQLSKTQYKNSHTGMKSTTRKSSTLPPPLNPVTNASFSFL